jgi:pyrroloquinoline quinone (PQQ) biosynthesis protein C
MFIELRNRFDPILEQFLSSPPMKLLASGKLTVDEYRSILKQVYYYVRENPQLQALATVYFRGRQRDLVKSFYQHAVSEIGHEQLALNDFQTLGGEDTNIPHKNPLPATSALTAYAFYQIYNLNPLGYIGYLFFLEFVPTQAGPILAEQFRASGVKDDALTFLRDHIEIDQAHNRLMERYVELLLQNPEDMDCVEYAMKTTSHLYEQMLSSAIKDAHEQVDTGWNWEELNADNITPDSRAIKTA